MSVEYVVETLLETTNHLQTNESKVRMLPNESLINRNPTSCSGIPTVLPSETIT